MDTTFDMTAVQIVDTSASASDDPAVMSKRLRNVLPFAATLALIAGAVLWTLWYKQTASLPAYWYWGGMVLAAVGLCVLLVAVVRSQLDPRPRTSVRRRRRY